jgi:hypothetical protein
MIMAMAPLAFGQGTIWPLAPLVPDWDFGGHSDIKQHLKKRTGRDIVEIKRNYQ